jgi:hypothetical protein
MGCTTQLSKDITSNCSTSRNGGLEIIAWIGKRTDLVITSSSTANKENTITNIVNAATKKCIKVTGIKKGLNAGHTLVSAENRPDKFAHYFNFEGFEILAEDITNLDRMDDVVVIVELKDKTTTGEGVFRVYGAKAGLYKVEDAQDLTANNGARTIKLQSMAGQEEIYSAYTLFITSYAASKVIFDALGTVPV